jgi:hypothetical protein
MSLPGISNAELIEFADSAMDAIASHEAYIVDGLVRVDVFKNNTGKLVVNELESFEAIYYTRTFNAEHFLEEYWERKIYDAINSLVTCST